MAAGSRDDPLQALSNALVVVVRAVGAAAAAAGRVGRHLSAGRHSGLHAPLDVVAVAGQFRPAQMRTLGTGGAGQSRRNSRVAAFSAVRQAIDGGIGRWKPRFLASRATREMWPHRPLHKQVL